MMADIVGWVGGGIALLIVGVLVYLWSPALRMWVVEPLTGLRDRLLGRDKLAPPSDRP